MWGKSEIKANLVQLKLGGGIELRKTNYSMWIWLCMNLNIISTSHRCVVYLYLLLTHYLLYSLSNSSLPYLINFENLIDSFPNLYELKCLNNSTLFKPFMWGALINVDRGGKGLFLPGY